jgi:hypothetical protein
VTNNILPTNRSRDARTVPPAVLAAVAVLSALLPLCAGAQSSVAGELFPFRDGIVKDGTTVIGPAHKGFFGSIPSETSHDSLSGWAYIAMPSVSYHFKPALSVDATLPYYLYMNAAQYNKEGELLVAGHEDVLGDMTFAGHYQRSFEWFDNTLTGATSAPTGDKSLGLGTGRMTGNVVDHLERQMTRSISTDLDVGFGDSSELVRESSRKNYTTLGKMGFVQGGSSVSLARQMTLEAHAYDQLPFGNQSVFTTIVRKNEGSTVLSGSQNAKDYGLSANFDVPITQKMGISANYSYSVPLQDTSIGVSLVVLLYKPIERY